MVLKKTPVCEFDLPAVQFSLPGVDGKTWSLKEVKGSKGLLVMFICNHCPYVKAIRERLVCDAKEIQQLGIGCVAICANDASDYPEDSFENMQKIAKAWQLPFPYLQDEAQEVAKAYDAVCTPDFFGYNKDLKLQYRGRIDELLGAMTIIAETGKGPLNQIPSMGCSIKWRPFAASDSII